MTPRSPATGTVSSDPPFALQQLEALLEFWFSGDLTSAAGAEAGMRRWFFTTPDEDRELGARFGALAEAAAQGRLGSCAAMPRGRLALILLLDQIPRNLYRGTRRAFATDARALELTLEGRAAGLADAGLGLLGQMFFLMPLQHAESLEVQRLSVEAFETLAAAGSSGPLRDVLEKTAAFARLHHEIVARFGRFPHRNVALGRESTPDEIEFLSSGGPSFGQ